MAHKKWLKCMIALMKSGKFTAARIKAESGEYVDSVSAKLHYAKKMVSSQDIIPMVQKIKLIKLY